jgi:hypothetical protein
MGLRDAEVPPFWDGQVPMPLWATMHEGYTHQSYFEKAVQLTSDYYGKWVHFLDRITPSFLISNNYQQGLPQEHHDHHEHGDHKLESAKGGHHHH